MKRVFLTLLFLLFLLIPMSIFAQSEGDKLNDLQKQINEYSKKVSELQSARKTLSSQIAYMDSQIQLTTLKISQTEQKILLLEVQIEDLSAKIKILDSSLNKLSAVFLNRVVATYKTGRVDPFFVLIFSPDVNSFFLKYKYLRALQLNDRKVLLSMEEARMNYDLQKQEKEKKQKELEVLKVQLDKQKKDLAQQKKDKEYLLVVTQNDEKKYQQFLAQVLAEYQAIQAIIAGKGEEKEISDVKEGEKIATVILGSSPCSTGTHLHFEVHDGDTIKNPFSYLKNTSLSNSHSGDEYFFGGDWNWPIDPPIDLTQGFGDNTWWIRIGGAPYKFHSGIDIVSDNSEVKAVREGKLYNGSVKCGSGYLRYIKVKHKDSNFSTFYLHINYEKT